MSTVGKFSGSWILGDCTQVHKEKETFFFVSLKEFSPCLCSTARQKLCCMCKIVVFLIGPIAFSDVLVASGVSLWSSNIREFSQRWLFLIKAICLNTKVIEQYQIGLFSNRTCFVSLKSALNPNPGCTQITSQMSAISLWTKNDIFKRWGYMYSEKHFYFKCWCWN